MNYTFFKYLVVKIAQILMMPRYGQIVSESSNDQHQQAVGVGPHPKPWPDDNRLDPELLENGDRRNVVDKYRYWTMEAIVADLDKQRHSFEVAIENWQHDLNIGTIVRTANAFLANKIHIVGKKRWNKRGAMVTDRYQHVLHHSTVKQFHEYVKESGKQLIGIDNLPGSRSITEAELRADTVFVFGQEGPGLSEEMRNTADQLLFIPQYGSTRSINAGVASGVAMYEWISQHAAS